MENIVVYTDGGSRGNPGPAAIGIHVESLGKKYLSLSERIGAAKVFGLTIFHEVYWESPSNNRQYSLFRL